MKARKTFLNLIEEHLRQEDGEVSRESLDYLYNDRNLIISCLYSLKLLYEDFRLPFSEFEKMCKGKAIEEIRMELDEYITCYNRGMSLRKWIEEICALFYAKKLKFGLDIESPMINPQEIESTLDLLTFISNYFKENSLLLFF